MVFELASGGVEPSFCSGFGPLCAAHLLDPLVLSRDVLRIDLFCFLYNVRCKILVFVMGLQVLWGFESPCPL